jgi:hypothetical protein
VSLKNFSSLFLCVLFLIPEKSYSTIYYVDNSKANNVGNGLSWTNAKKDVQEAINIAASGDTIWIKLGVYYPTKDVTGNTSPANNRDKTFFISKSLHLFGGFNGTETALAARNYRTNSTILNGDLGTINLKTDNAYHVVFITDAINSGINVTLDGFIIRHGVANGIGSNTTIGSKSFSKYYGGGVIITGGNNLVKNCTIDSNSAGLGGGIHMDGNTTILNNVIINNIAGDNGGGIECLNGYIFSNFISKNGAEAGGGIHVYSDSALVMNNVIYDNFGNSYGGGLSLQKGKNKIVNNTIIKNIGINYGGGVEISDSSNYIVNNIFWNNQKNTAIYTLGSDLALARPIHSCINNFLQNTNDTSHYPKSNSNWSNNFYRQNPNVKNPTLPLGSDGIFRTADDGFALLNSSMVINAGSSSINNPLDVLDSNRINGYDVGAYEFRGPCHFTYSYIKDTICPGKIYIYNGRQITISGSYKDTFINWMGCDSIQTLTLTIKPKFSRDTINRSICNGDSFFFKAKYRKVTGYYNDSLLNKDGCDSFITLNLLVKAIKRDTIRTSICIGDSLLFNNLYRKMTGIFYDTFTSTAGCDSFVTLILLVNSSISQSINRTICPGDSFLFNNLYRKTIGVYYDTLTAIFGCDSIIALNLSIFIPPKDTIKKAICAGDSFLFNSTHRKIAGFYNDTLISKNGCDSFITLNLSINNKKWDTFKKAVCLGDSFYFNSRYRKSAGYYYDTLISKNGCDSFLTLILKINPLPTINISLTLGKLVATNGFTSYRWKWNTTTINSSSNTLTPPVSALYRVEVTDTNLCKNFATYNYISSSLRSPNDNSLMLYPNPTNGKLTIQGLLKMSKVTINSLSGAFIQEFFTRDDLDLSHLNNGVYYLLIEDKTYKILVEKK